MPSRKGSPNRNKQYLMKRLQDMYGDDFHPIMRMAEAATDLQAKLAAAKEQQTDTVDLYRAAIDAWDRIAQYTEPKLKAMEVTGGDGEPLIPMQVVVRPASGSDGTPPAEGV